MNIAVTIGSARLDAFVELNLAYARRIWPDAEILVNDCPSETSKEVEAHCSKYEADYWCEDVDRGHFSGDVQSTVNGLVFAKSVGADILIKLNQRFVIIHEHMQTIIESVFSHDQISLALPGRPDRSRILGAPFYSDFPFLVDCLLMRVKDFDAERLRDEYQNQCTEMRQWSDAYVEVFWMNQVNGPLAQRFAILHCLANHERHWPAIFLRKIQNTVSDYIASAQAVGINRTDFDLREWSQIKGYTYQPFPKLFKTA